MAADLRHFFAVWLSVLLLGAGVAALEHRHSSLQLPPLSPLAGARSVDQVARALDGTAGARMRSALAGAGVPPRPERLWLLAIKDARRLELWAEGATGARTRVRTWRILAASGTAGPKLREGDGQVPEGIYRIELLNPNSAYHLSLRIDYPNAADRAWARRDGRSRLGGEIFIHGKAVSIGCIAIGDSAIEELFWLAATVGTKPFTVLVVPTDLRRNPAPEVARPWAPELYRSLRAALEEFPTAVASHQASGFRRVARVGGRAHRARPSRPRSPD